MGLGKSYPTIRGRGPDDSPPYPPGSAEDANGTRSSRLEHPRPEEEKRLKIGETQT